MSARVLRTIDKLGGLDEYLLGEKASRIKDLGESGWWLRWAIMQTQTVKSRFAAERQRLGLPADRSELEAATETLGAEEETALDEDALEAVPMDDAFQIEQNADLPPIKFRVDRFKHVMLTSNGWVRTRRSPDHSINKAKEGVQKKFFPEYVEKRLEAFEAELAPKLEFGEEGEEPELNESQYKELVKHARRTLKGELRELVDQKYEYEVARKEMRKQAKREAKAKKAAAEEADTTVA